MKLSAFKQHLNAVSQLSFIDPNGNFVPKHFHITEVGLINKHFIDCGGTVRTKKSISFQVWTANDFEHRLAPQKLNIIIDAAQPLFGNEDLDVEIEYQTETISRYGLSFNGNDFLLTPMHTDCLAKDHCGIPPEKLKIRLSDLQTSKTTCCPPNNKCC